MSDPTRPRILVVDDEEAILETMAFTFQDDYDVSTTTDAREALRILDEKAPMALVLTDQRMPSMTGVEFLTKVWERHPSTVRMILTGFADMGAIIDAINDGHVYAYITKPWEPDELKQVVKRAVEHHQLSAENARLMTELRRANRFIEAAMDRLDTGALAVDEAGVVQAVNRPAREYLGLTEDPRGRELKEVLQGSCREVVGAAAYSLAEREPGSFEEVEVQCGEHRSRLRISVQNLADPSEASLGRVVLFREVSHEPLRRRFEELVGGLVHAEDSVRPRLEDAREQLRELVEELRGSHIESPGIHELAERASRTLTAIDNWLDVDDALACEEYPDAQLLLDRMRVAMTRWPLPEELPERVRELAREVEAYYESGENPKRRIL